MRYQGYVAVCRQGQRRELLADGFAEHLNGGTSTQVADYYEAVLEGGERVGKQAANWVINELLGALNKADREITETPVDPEQLGAILDLQKEGTISGKIAKDLFEIVFAEGGDPRRIRIAGRGRPGKGEMAQQRLAGIGQPRRLDDPGHSLRILRRTSRRSDQLAPDPRGIRHIRPVQSL